MGEEGKDKELKRDGGGACLPGVGILGSLSDEEEEEEEKVVEEVQAFQTQRSSRSEARRSGRVRASAPPPGKLKVQRQMLQEVQLCDAVMAEPTKKNKKRKGAMQLLVASGFEFMSVYVGKPGQTVGLKRKRLNKINHHPHMFMGEVVK